MNSRRSCGIVPLSQPVPNKDPDMKIRSEQYYSYLLRLWPIKWNEHWIWRAILENIHTGERTGFASMDALLVFLQEMEKEGEEPARTNETHD